MDVDIFTNKMTGQWVAQSTSYSLLYNYVSSPTFINNFIWRYVKNDRKYMNTLLPKLQKEYDINQLYLYTIEFKESKYYQNNYYVVFLKQQSDLSILLKVNDKFQIINRFTIKDYSTRHLSLTSNINQTEIFQKIYFLNNNVKVIKSIAKKYNQNIGTCFSSEIRIS